MTERVGYKKEHGLTAARKAAALALAVGLVGCVHESTNQNDANYNKHGEISNSQYEPQTIPPVESPNPTQAPEISNMEVEINRTVDCMVERCIALTFDDGPGPYTEQLLDYLDEHDAKATFFMVGSRVDEYDSVVTDVRDRGHQLGNHSWQHDDLSRKSPQGAADDVERTNQAIEDVAGVRPKVIRPPYGATSSSMREAIDQPEILWSIDTEDWKYHDSDYVANYVKDHAGRGDIILMHDIHETSVEAVPEILDYLDDEGYEIVTVDNLLGDSLSADTYYRQDI